MNYNVKAETIIRYPYLEGIDVAMNNVINEWGHFLRDVLPNGFQTIMEISDLKKDQLDYRLSVPYAGSNTDKISGSFAQVKMDTLNNFPEFSMTGTLSIAELVGIMRRQCPNYDTSTFSNLENVSQLTRAQQEELRREFGITAYLGGIRIPFQRRISSAERGTAIVEDKEFRIAFSALSGEGDLNMCLCLFYDLQQIMQTAEPNVTYQFDLSQLKKNQTANFLITLHGIRGVVRK